MPFCSATRLYPRQRDLDDVQFGIDSFSENNRPELDVPYNEKHTYLVRRLYESLPRIRAQDKIPDELECRKKPLSSM